MQSQDISEFCNLGALIASMPLGSVENERRFSHMNLTKTKLRNRLDTEHLNDAMSISASRFTPANFPYRQAL